MCTLVWHTEVGSHWSTDHSRHTHRPELTLSVYMRESHSFHMGQHSDKQRQHRQMLSTETTAIVYREFRATLQIWFWLGPRPSHCHKESYKNKLFFYLSELNLLQPALSFHRFLNMRVEYYFINHFMVSSTEEVLFIFLLTFYICKPKTQCIHLWMFMNHVY